MPVNKAREKVNDFLIRYNMHYDCIDFDESCSEFIKDMEAGLEGKESSLMMLPTYISMEKEIPADEPIIVMDAGGTNFRVAVVCFDKDRKAVIEDFKLFSMPGTKGEIGREELFSTIAEYMKPVLGKSNKIGFCFSYPTEVHANRDGKLISFSKEVKVRDVEGLFIGENLIKTIKQMGYSGDKSIVLLNDTVATLLGGRAFHPDRSFDGYMGFILGTGTNTCYIEENRNIRKIPELKNSAGSMLINMESGTYSKIPRGKFDIEFDNSTKNPGKYAFEKMMSGAYQGGLTLTVIKGAIEEGLFSGDFALRAKGFKELASKEIDDFLLYPYGDNVLAKLCADDSDRLVLYYLIDAIFERAAKLVAVNLTAVMMKTGKGTNPCSPVCITAEGTTFYKSRLFKIKLDHYIRTFTNDKKSLYCEFVKAENTTLIGTAIAGLLN
ncbi:MAG: hexokinase [Clostridia bacterium]|nr:hexokinase [Clostridia bacterium]